MTSFASGSDCRFVWTLFYGDDNLRGMMETMQLQVTPEFRRQLESEAAKLHLSPAAYILYLHSRTAPNREAGRLDRHVHEVFGKHGDLMRRLAK